MTGKFITFEGAEGSGKSTQSRLIAQYLKERGLDVLEVREPGGVKISEAIRHILLDVANARMTDECEVLLYMAARSQLVKEVVLPALETGKIVLCDRFLDSTFAYQGYGNGVDLAIIREIGYFATKGIVPDLTLVFDIEAEKGLSRTGSHKDRIEQRSLDYHRRVRDGYLALAGQEPGRMKVIPVNGEKEEVHAIVREHVERLLHLFRS